MSHTVIFKIRDKGTGEEAALPGEFTPEEWATFGEFDRSAGQLFDLRVFGAASDVSVSIKWTETEGLVGSATLPPEDDLLAMIHRLRPFVLNDERTNFYAVCNILKRRFRHPVLDRTIALIRDTYTGRRMQGVIKISTADGTWNSHGTLMKWLNAFEYHRDPEKQAELSKFLATFPSDAARGVIVLLLFQVADAVFKLGQVLRAVRGERAPGPLEVDFESAR